MPDIRYPKIYLPDIRLNQYPVSGTNPIKIENLNTLEMDPDPCLKKKVYEKVSNIFEIFENKFLLIYVLWTINVYREQIEAETCFEAGTTWYTTSDLAAARNV